MPDRIFADPRLARLYDSLEPDRADLDLYLSMVEEFGAQSVVDVGCGTGTFACLLADQGIDAIGVDPAVASLDVARRKRGADRVRWIQGDSSALPSVAADLVTMTGNVAQVFLDDEEITTVLRDLRRAVHPGGRVVFEVRDPRRRAWRSWNREETYKATEIPGTGLVESWAEVLVASPPLVTFRWTYEFKESGEVLTSDSTLRFRSRDEVERAVALSGLFVDDVRDAPDRPGLEFVFVCRRASD